MIEKIDEKVKLGIIGKSLPYTLSPKIHNLFMKGRGDLSYDILEYKNIDLLRKEKLFKYNGINVTVPYKREIIKYLDELRADALELQAVNTISTEYGKLVGYNTDTYGFMQMLKANKINPQKKVCVVLGSGGASQAVQYVLKQMKAEKVIVVSRYPHGNNMCTYEELNNIKGYLIVNTTPVGTSPNVDVSPVEENVVKNFDALVDIVYNPSTTKFLSYGIMNNKTVVNGLYMLVSQAVKSEEYWQNIKYNKSEVDSIYYKIKKNFEVKNQSNIYLIGMMGCGKSTLGKELAKKLDYDFVDMDEMIEKYTHMTISQLFEKGEDFFRDIESSVLKHIALNMKKTVVATGGGVIKKDANIYTMKISGLTIWVDRDINLIEQDCDTSNRPLLKGKNQYILTIYNERKATYNFAKDVRFKNNKSLEDGVNSLYKKLKKVAR